MKLYLFLTVCAKAGSVCAGSVSRAPVVAGLDVAEVAVPAVVARAVAGLAGPVRAAVHVATL